MEASNYFTCLSYDGVDFLIQSRHVVAGVYLDVQREARHVVFNRETLPHIYIGGMLEREFLCASREEYSVVLVMRMQDFVRDVRAKILSYTDTAFPASGNLALSVNGEISNRVFNAGMLRLLPQGIRGRMGECGICAIGFGTEEDASVPRKRILISPDMLLRKFFSTRLMRQDGPQKGGGR